MFTYTILTILCVTCAWLEAAACLHKKVPSWALSTNQPNCIFLCIPQPAGARSGRSTGHNEVAAQSLHRVGELERPLTKHAGQAGSHAQARGEPAPGYSHAYKGQRPEASFLARSPGVLEGFNKSPRAQSYEGGSPTAVTASQDLPHAY